jgi:hypothetical protein
MKPRRPTELDGIVRFSTPVPVRKNQVLAAGLASVAVIVLIVVVILVLFRRTE